MPAGGGILPSQGKFSREYFIRALCEQAPIKMGTEVKLNMNVRDLEPRRVTGFFADICAIPHGSGNTKAISDYCAAFARERGLEYHQDELDNLIIIKPASPGYENSPAVIVQGHMDMVCEKAPGCAHDFTAGGLELDCDDNYIFARGTTLGGDDGIAVAAALALLDDGEIAHPRLEVVLTVDEEVGMTGASGLDVSPLKGRRMLNLDSESEGLFIAGCAGGVRAACLFPARRERVAAVPVTLTLGGLRGGHSGQEIDKCRGNANMLMGRVLLHIGEKLPLRLVSIDGGAAENAIAAGCRAVTAVAPEHAGMCAALAREIGAVIKNELAAADPGVFLLAEAGEVAELEAVRAGDTQTIIDALTLLPNGIQSMSADMPSLVQTSLNLGLLNLEGETLRACFCVRSSVDSEKAALVKRLERLCGSLGGAVELSGDYPAWEYRKDSPLCAVMRRVYSEQYGCQPRVMAFHAGLECGIFAKKLPGLDCVSAGPTILDIHTPRERMDIASVQRLWAFLLEVLKRLK